jgi:hypothetical protein
VLLAVVAAATAARLALVAAGPDLDSDAYGHAVIGRTLLFAPADLRLHWVWLPLWQYVFTALALVGRGLDDVRLANVLLAAATPILLAGAVERHLARARSTRSERAIDAVVPFFAGALACLWPLALEHGQSGEPEPLFATLLVAACFAVERGRPWWGGAALAVACVLRYEAWAVVPAFALASVTRAWRAPEGARARAFAREAGAWGLPLCAIAAWIVLHQRATGEWLQFLRVNREFARAARAVAAPGVGPEPTALWYAASLPQRNLERAALLALPGLVWLVRRAPLTLALVGPTLLAFVTYGWVRQQHLGLDRHMYAVVPFYSLAVAGGAAEVARLALRVLPSRARVVALVHVGVCFWVGVRTLRYFTVPAFERSLGEHAAAWVHERGAAEIVRQGQPARVFCDLPRVEVFSRVAPGRFVRWNVADVEPLHADGEAAAFGKAYLVSRPDKLTKLEGEGRVAYDSPEVRVVEWRVERKR